MAVCPRCKRALTPGETALGPAPVCPSCDHAWIAPEQIEAFQDSAERRYRGDELDALRKEALARRQTMLDSDIVYCDCPGCARRMLRRTYGETSFLLVHYCAAHGYWIGAEQIRGIVDWVRRGGEVLELRRRIEHYEEETRRLRIDLKGAELRAYQGDGGAVVPFMPFG